MQWELVKPWVNRVGIVLEFLSFWLAAPEILGEERLSALERMIERWVLLVPVTVVLLSAGVLIWVVRISNSFHLLETMILIPAALLMAALVRSLLKGDWERLTELYKAYGAKGLKLAFAVSSVVLGVFMLGECLKWRAELPVEILLGFVVVALWFLMLSSVAWLPDKVLSPLLLQLADDKRIRRRSLAVGAVLFMVGFLLQFIATF